jgi:hypothetical protein
VTSLAEAEQRLRDVAHVSFGSLGDPVDPDSSLRPLRDCVEELEKTQGTLAATNPSLVEAAARSWMSGNGDLRLLPDRYVRALCGEASLATDPVFVAGLAAHPELRAKRQWLERLSLSYFTEWRRMDSPEQLEFVLKQSISAGRCTSKRLDRWREGLGQVFSATAASWFAREAIASRRLPPDVLSEWFIDAGSGLGMASADASIVRWAEVFEEAKGQGAAQSAVAKELYWQLMHGLLNAPTLGSEVVGRAISAVLLWDEIDRDDDIRSNLETFLLDDSRFGDPRLSRNSAKWQAVSEPARRRAVAWLAKKDLLFFFEFVIRDDPHGRKEFWLQYIDQVEDSNVALCSDDLRRLRASTRADERLRYSQVIGAGDVSAFLMRFRGAGGLVFIEFSRSGNALYIHNADVFQEAVGGIRLGVFHLVHDLKHRKAVGKVTHHISTWRAKVADMLLRLGIRRSLWASPR